MSEPLLLLEGLEKRFGEFLVLRGVGATIPKGSITAFIGPNGAGKTTLFHVITGDLRPDSGSVVYRGKCLVGLPPWRVARLGLGKMFQDVRIFQQLTILENVLLALHDHPGRSAWSSIVRALLRDRRRQDEQAQAEHWLEMAGVERPWERPAGLLSFGNQKLLALARLLAGGFDLLLLDEPAAGLAPAFVDRIGRLLTTLVQDGKASVALIEHNFSFVSAVADQAYLLRAGEVHASGPTAQVLERAENREILIGV